MFRRCVYPLRLYFRTLHFTAPIKQKLYQDRENDYAYTILSPLFKQGGSFTLKTGIKTVQEFNVFMDQNWRTSTASEIVGAFEQIKDLVVKNEINLSDSRFDRLVDGLMDHCEKLTDDELQRLLSVLTEYPPCEASTSHNYHDVWSCLDDICCWKMAFWPVEKLLIFAEFWYKLNLGRLSDFIYEMLDRATAKPQKLTRDMFLYLFFYFNVNRRRVIGYNFEYALSQRISEFKPDELAVIAMGYFKTRSKIKMMPVINAMIQAINENHETLDEVSLTAMLKAIRLSQRVESAPLIPAMLDRLIPEIPRLSVMSQVHIALTGTSLQIKHEKSLKECSLKILENLESVRVKEIERILLALSMFHLDTNPSFFDKSFKEICKESRRQEFIKYDRCLPSVLHYLSFHKLYHYEMSNHLLHDDYINDIYGKNSRNVPRELFSLDACLEIDCPDYTGTRLSPHKKYKAAKWLTEFTPKENQPQRLTLADKSFLEVSNIVRSLVSLENLTCDHVLPHFSKPDIILCKDEKTGKFIEPLGFQNYYLGDIMRPIELKNQKWYALMIMTPNLTARDSHEPLGAMLMKRRQLKTVGYHPIMINITQIGALPPSDRAPFILSLLS